MRRYSIKAGPTIVHPDSYMRTVPFAPTIEGARWAVGSGWVLRDEPGRLDQGVIYFVASPSVLRLAAAIVALLSRLRKERP